MDSDSRKREAARHALGAVRPGMKLGLGTGSTAAHFVDLLGEKVAHGFDCVCVATSKATQHQAERLSIPMAQLDTLERLDLTVDGADEIDRDFQLIKGGGAALLREKIIATASDRMVVIADDSKKVQTLGAFPLPIEVNLFGLGVTHAMVRNVMAAFGAEGEAKLRRDKAGEPVLTDGGHAILDASFGRICDAKAVSHALNAIPGVVENGLFLDICTEVFLAGAQGVTHLMAPPRG